MQWSLKSLLIAAAIIPVAIYMLAKADAIVASLVSSLAVLGLLAMAIAAMVDRGPRRTFAIGFVAAAVGYEFISWHFHSRGVPLVTDKLLEFLFARYSLTSVVPVGGNGAMRTVVTPNNHSFHHVGQIYWCMILGMLGGWFAMVVERRRTREEQTENSQV